MRKLATILGLALGLFAAAPASAQAFAEWEEGPWRVYQMKPEDCWMVYAPPGGDDLSFQLTSTDLHMYVWAVRPGWTFVVPDRDYPFRVMFGNVVRRETAGGLERHSGVATLLPDMQPEEIEALLTARLAYVTVRDSDDFEVRLDPAALAEFRKCIARIGGVGSKPGN